MPFHSGCVFSSRSTSRRIATSAAVPPGAVLRRRKSSWRGASTAALQRDQVVLRRIVRVGRRRVGIVAGRARTRSRADRRNGLERVGRQRIVRGERIAREHGARNFAALGEQRVAKLDRLRAGGRRGARSAGGRPTRTAVSRTKARS